MKQFLLSSLLSLAAANAVYADLELAYPFSDNMVLQRGAEIPVWGTADAGQSVAISYNGKQAKAVADSNGKWLAKLPAMQAKAAGSKLKVSVKGESKELSNVVVGDVWYATGQSNMGWMLKQSTGGAAEIQKSADSGLRLFNHKGTLHPGGKQYEVEFLKQMNEENYYATNGWQESSPSTSPEMSGVAYFFGKKLREEVKVPIGIVNVAVGGTPIEAHISPEQFASDKKLSRLLKDWWKNDDYPSWCRGRAAHNLKHWFSDSSLKGETPPHPFTPTFLWKAGPERFQPMPIKGVIWYQGESNAGKDGTPEATISGELNKKKFKLLVESWRQGWDNPELPVYYVQLPGMNRKWPVFREMQLQASKEISNVGMAVTIDVGHPKNVHPGQKKPVGERLARLALADTYGQDIVPNGPIYERMKVKGGVIYVDFANNKGLQASDGGEIRGFEIAGSDKKFYSAQAEVVGKYLKLESEKVSRPVAVRYAWDNDPECNLTNGEGLPASPFRTDSWKNVDPSGNVTKGKAVAAVGKKSDVIRVACIGDSITFGLGIKGKGNSYPAQLQKLLGKKYEVRNFGNSGRGIMKKAMRGRQKRAYIFMKEHKQALEYEPHIVVCNLGINDLMEFDKYGKELKGDYVELLEAYKSLDTYPRVIVWNKLAPLFPGQTYYGSPNVEKINEEIAKAAKKLDIETIDLYAPLKGHPEMFPDKIHPNAAGAKIIAETVAELLKKK